MTIEMNVTFENEQNFDVQFANQSAFDCGFDGLLPGDYSGAYNIIPSSEAQTLETAGKTLTANVVIEPIPSNYGLITWNGAALTVS